MDVGSALPRDNWIKQGTTLVPAPYRRSSTGDDYTTTIIANFTRSSLTCQGLRFIWRVKTSTASWRQRKMVARPSFGNCFR